MKKYQQIIPLGFGCMVAQDLEKIGVRDHSYPFDWVISNFKDVIRLIDNRFAGIFQEVEQDAMHDNVYHDRQTGLDHYHDFFPDKSIEEQMDAVRKKYARRIERFYESIKEPTLFIRFVRNVEDWTYTKENGAGITTLLKSFNKENVCVYVLAKDLEDGVVIENVFITEDKTHPILACKALKRLLKKEVKISYGHRLKNRYRYICKVLKKSFRG